ncbi:MAG: helix-turn-helix transcriptional regulator [Thermodesulfobacteriota bacterium]|nr:helix-turn-helix transcriptional regulator [Thermodesulfobacteriota bacterium]
MIAKEDELVSWDEMFPDTHPGVILRGAREMENLTQAKLAANIGVTRHNISAMETGKRRITIDMAKRLAKALNTSYKNFL